MKHRNNAVYTGQRKRVSTGGTDNRYIVDLFYKKLNSFLSPSEEIEIIPPEQVSPTRSIQDQVYIMKDYCIRKVLPEVTGLFDWGDKVTPRLRALAPIVDQETVNAAIAAIAAYTTNTYSGAHDLTAAAAAHDAIAAAAAYHPAYAARFPDINASVNAARANDTARCVYAALVATIDADNEAAYNRIIDLTNEMLESL